MRCILILILTFLVACEHPEPDYRLSKDITQYATDSFHVNDSIGQGYHSCDVRVHDSRFLITACDPDKIRKFVVVDRTHGRIDSVKDDPVNEHATMEWDADGDTLYIIDAISPKKIRCVDLTTKKQHDLVIGPVNGMPFDFSVNKGQLFCLGDSRGYSVIKLQDSIFQILNEARTATPYYQSSVVSSPFDNKINLLSGLGSVTAIDKRNYILWTQPLPYKNDNIKTRILNYENLFVIKYDSTLLAMDKQTGKELWKLAVGSELTDIHKVGDNILSYSFEQFNARKTIECKNVFNVIDSKTGKIVWHKEIKSNGESHYGLLNNKLLISDSSSLTILNPQTGVELNKISYPKTERDHHTFRMIEDPVTGRFYIQAFNDVLYW